MNYRRCYGKSFWMASVSAIGLLLTRPAAPAAAQANAPAPTNAPAEAAPTLGQIEDVTVTARKRSEKLLDVPIAITALSAKTIQTRGIYSITDLADQTPGLTVDSTVAGSGRSDRSFPIYVIRGMNPSLTTNPTTIVFVDGAPLISGQIDGLEDLERVEVLKGPQAAYFGRETFAGAISLITKDPSATLKGTVDALVASPNWYDERITLEGPIVTDKLDVRGTYRFYSRQGSWDNEAVADKTSQHLGDQSTQDGNIEIVARPVDDLKIKALGMFWHDDDGPSAQELIEPSQSNCLGFWFCGVVPKPLPSQPASNDLVTPPMARLLQALGTPDAQQAFRPLNSGYGLVRNGYHGSVNVDYDFENLGFTATSLTAIDNQRFSELQDLANDDGSQLPNFAASLGLPFANKYYDYPFFVEDGYRSLSQELRLTSDQDQRFRWLAGFNYAWSRVDSSLGGGSGFDYFVGDSPQSSNTYGMFASGSYDILRNLTLTAEGRYQIDKESTTVAGANGYNYFTGVFGPLGPGGKTYTGTYRDFLPRVSLQYKIVPKIMAYATYSVGVNPATYNGNIAGLPGNELAVLEKDFGATVAVKPEHVVNYELGVKGRFLDDTLTLAADVYYDIWSKQVETQTVNFFYDGILEQTSAEINAGKTHLKGLEGEVNWEPIPHFVIDVSGAVNDTTIKSGNCFTCLERIGTEDVDGNQLPDVSKYQATVGASYDGTFGFLSGTALDRVAEAGWFARVDYTYKSGLYEDKDNLVRTPAENLVNIRVGVTYKNLRIEGFVDNLTNWSGPTSLSAIVNLGSLSETYVHANDALVGGLPFLRSYGLRLRYTFGMPAATPPEGPAPLAPLAPPPAASPVRTYLVFFDWDRADLTSRARQIVATAASASQSGGTTKIEVNGYTDLSGTPAYNQKLSVRRAEAVKVELVRDGVPAGEIGIKGYGETNPLVPTAPGVREPQNRRVEIILD